ncbi:hypothetical protein [Psychrobacter sp. ANT_WB68]|uniref:hypothetical protein n=1 Tax=Psychrobacter sp. ANT_WB68 TaxID=2597355 RepID=UPI0011F1550F|nr:hypothetical protein [Psychrobacter sp. ANT_WB68]KAA0915906.1 hypothetical protein FQ084_05065 [Psychrobacter sp. ANT_WB68]
MSDKKSNQSADLEANLAKIANAKPRRRSRKDNIYERFITRVENVDSADSDGNREQTNGEGWLAPLKPLKNADKLSSYEPLSAAELELFASQQDELQQETSLKGKNTTSTGVNLDFSDENEDLATSHAAGFNLDKPSNTESDDDYSDNHNDNIARETASLGNDDHYHYENPDIDDLATQRPTELVPSKDIKLASSKKPLIIGMIVGSLLIAAIVLTLIFTGFLSTTPPATDSDTSNGSNKVNAADNTPNASNQPTVDSETSVPSTDKKNTAKNIQVADGQPKALTTNDSENESASEPAITYEDFRQESQSTLFRETND